MKIVDRPSPNHGPRPAGVRPTLIVLHGTAGKSEAGDLAWLCSREARVSYHYLIGRDGTVYRLVGENDRAWHAGISEWFGKPNVNDYAIGVAFANDGKEPYTGEQYKAGKALVADIRARHSIPLDHVVGHCHVSPGRKTDPWLHFHWLRLV